MASTTCVVSPVLPFGRSTGMVRDAMYVAVTINTTSSTSTTSTRGVTLMLEIIVSSPSFECAMTLAPSLRGGGLTFAFEIRQHLVAQDLGLTETRANQAL